MLFAEKINNWDDWAKVYQSIPAFEGIIREILIREKLPLCEIEHLTPGTNAVFKVGDVVLKIYAPKESGMDQTADRRTEIYATDFADIQGICTPKILAEGIVHDKYSFAYIVMKYLPGRELGEVLKTSDSEYQFILGKQLCEVTERLNVPSVSFNEIDVIQTPDRSDRWKPYPDSFKVERQAHIDNYDYGEFVLVHGDLCPDNILVTDVLIPIDFADAVLAPKCYEHALIFFEYQKYPAFLKGYFEKEDSRQLVKGVFDGILIHDFGGDIVKNTLGSIDEFTSLKILREKIKLLTQQWD